MCPYVMSCGLYGVVSLVVNLGGQLLYQGIYFIVGAEYAFLAEQVGYAGTYVLTLFRSEEDGGACADDCASEEGIEHG